MQMQFSSCYGVEYVHYTGMQVTLFLEVQADRILVRILLKYYLSS